MKHLLLLFLLQDPGYETVRIETDRAVDTVYDIDVDADGKQDLLLQAGKDIRVHLGGDGGFSGKPDHVLRMSADTFLWTLARIGKEKTRSVVTATSKGIRIHRFSKGRFQDPQDLVVHPNLFERTSAEKKAPLMLDFMPDLNEDGRSDALLFQEEEVWTLIQQKDASFRLTQKIPIPIELSTMILPGAHNRIRGMSSVPNMAFVDFTGDGKRDIVYYRDESFGVYAQGEDGRFESAGTFDIAKKKQKKRYRYMKFGIPPQLADFNGDGTADLAIAYSSKGKVHLYYARKGRKDFKSPDHVVRIDDGWSTAIHGIDFNGDGRSDLVMAGVEKLGIISGISVFLSKRIDLQLHFYLSRKGTAIPRKPDRILSFSIPFSFHATRDSAEVDLVFRPNFDGDFDGDGLRDVLVQEDEDTISIYRGDAKTCVQSEPGWKIGISPPESTIFTKSYVSDLNGDGKSDVVLQYVSVGTDRQVVELKLSRRNR